MDESWAGIAAYFRGVGESSPGAVVADALSALERLAEHIGSGPMAKALFGWTAMLDLCVQQTDVRPHSGPFLRIRPLLTGLVEFRYEDTAIRDRQWCREVPPSGVIGRFDAFLDQLGWMRRSSG